MSDDWGKPGSRVSRKRIRGIRYEDQTVYVHGDLVEVFTAFLQMLGEHYVPLPPGTTGFIPGDDGPMGRGIAVHLPNGPLPREVVIAATALKLLVRNDGVVEFTGTRADADVLSRWIVERRTTAEDSIENALVEIYRPGTRHLAPGMLGPDVRFLQLFMNAKDDSGAFGTELESKVAEFRQIRHLPPGVECDQAFWLSMFKERMPHVSPGEGGMWVRMVQAGLVALQYSENPITSVYGTRTQRDVRWMQESNQIRVTGFVRGAEWGLLTHRPVDGFPLG